MSETTTRINDVYDVDPKQRELIEWRAKRRLELRNKYLREIHNPNRNHDGHLFDPQIQRNYSTNFAYERIFKPTVQNFIWQAILTAGAIGITCWRVKVYRDAKEYRYRTGQVSYRDRDWKFV